MGEKNGQGSGLGIVGYDTARRMARDPVSASSATTPTSSWLLTSNAAGVFIPR
jgi:hypothetical protein